MILNFKTAGTRDVAYGFRTKQAARTLPLELHMQAQEVLALLNVTETLQVFKGLGYKLEQLKREREGQWSVRINQKYRICFLWEDGDASKVEIVDYH